MQSLADQVESRKNLKSLSRFFGALVTKTVAFQSVAIVFILPKRVRGEEFIFALASFAKVLMFSV